MDIQREISALARIGIERNIEGQRIAFAYGYGGLDEAQRDYLFEIVIRDGELVATVDRYIAAGVPPIAFDVDAWEAAQLHLTAPIERRSFRELARCARAILAGRSIALAGGAVLQGIKRSAGNLA